MDNKALCGHEVGSYSPFVVGIHLTKGVLNLSFEVVVKREVKNFFTPFHANSVGG